MKVKLMVGLIVVALVAVAVIVQRSGNIAELSVGEAVAASQSSVAKASAITQTSSSLPVAANEVFSSAPLSASASSAASSLSYPRVDPAQQIKDFLTAMDETAVPKVAVREVKREELFDYAQATPEQLKAKALGGDPYAALDYAKYLNRNVVWVRNEKGDSILNPDKRKRAEAAQDVREFLVRAMSGGLMEAALALSRSYSGQWMYQVEALAWRKIAFAMGESERFDCLRDSTTCVVKDFNNLNRDEFFYPCVSMAYDRCTKATYEDATLLALQYLNSFEFAIKSPHPDTKSNKK